MSFFLLYLPALKLLIVVSGEAFRDAWIVNFSKGRGRGGGTLDPPPGHCHWILPGPRQPLVPSLWKQYS